MATSLGSFFLGRVCGSWLRRRARRPAQHDDAVEEGSNVIASVQPKAEVAWLLVGAAAQLPPSKAQPCQGPNAAHPASLGACVGRSVGSHDRNGVRVV